MRERKDEEIGVKRSVICHPEEKWCGVCLWFQDECPNHQERVQRGNRVPPLRRPDCQPLPQPLWADQERFDGEEHQEIQERTRERRESSCRKGWKWEIYLFGYVVVVIISFELFFRESITGIKPAFLCMKLWISGVLWHKSGYLEVLCSSSGSHSFEVSQKLFWRGKIVALRHFAIRLVVKPKGSAASCERGLQFV